MGATGTSNVAGGTSGVAQLSLPYIIILKSFVVNFLDKKLSRFFRRLLFKFFLFCFVFSKTMCLVVNLERR